MFRIEFKDGVVTPRRLEVPANTPLQARTPQSRQHAGGIREQGTAQGEGARAGRQIHHSSSAPSTRANTTSSTISIPTRRPPCWSPNSGRTAMGSQLGNVVFVDLARERRGAARHRHPQCLAGRQQADARARPAVFCGRASPRACSLAVALGAVLIIVRRGASPMTRQHSIQTAAVLVAAALIVQMVFWMRRHGRTLKRDLETSLQGAADRSNWWGVFMLALIAVAREGSETVVFLYGTLAAARSGAVLAPLAAAPGRASLLALGDLLPPAARQPGPVLAAVLPHHRNHAAVARRVAAGDGRRQSHRARRSCRAVRTAVGYVSPILPDSGLVGGLVGGADRLSGAARPDAGSRLRRLLGRDVLGSVLAPAAGQGGMRRRSRRVRCGPAASTRAAPRRRLADAQPARDPRRSMGRRRSSMSLLVVVPAAAAAAAAHRAHLDQPDAVRAVRVLGHLVALRAAQHGAGRPRCGAACSARRARCRKSVSAHGRGRARAALDHLERLALRRLCRHHDLRADGQRLSVSEAGAADPRRLDRRGHRRRLSLRAATSASGAAISAR